MSALQTPRHQALRSFFRMAGVLVALAGLIFMAVGMASFFKSFGGEEPPRLFWCAFVGMPLLFVGLVLSSMGYMGAMARYAAAEQTPVAADAINDLAEGTQPGIRTAARAATEGMAEGKARNG